MRRGEAIKFKTSELSVSNRVWHNFICAKLLPVAHMSDVTRERAVLLYAIATGRTIDIGKIIYQSIRHIRRGSTTGGLGHPSLIMALCRAAGVTWNPNEELVHPKIVMDKSFIMGLRGAEPMAQVQEPERIEQGPGHEAQGPDHAEAGPSRPARAHQTSEDHMELLRRRQYEYQVESFGVICERQETIYNFLSQAFPDIPAPRLRPLAPPPSYSDDDDDED